jgi:hypothetical protein
MINCLEGSVTSGLELAIDGNKGILVETGIGLEAGFGLGSAFVNVVVMTEETNTPFKGFEGMIVFERVSLALGFFDEFAVFDAGCGPMRREMVGIELENGVFGARITAYDNMFFVFAAFFLVIYGSTVRSNGINEHEIAYASCGRSRNRRTWDIMINNGVQTGNYVCF